MLGNACGLSHDTAAPVSLTSRCLQSLGDHFFDHLILDAARSPARWRIGERLNSIARITAAQFTNRRQRDSFASADLGSRQSRQARRMRVRSASRCLDLGRLAIKVSFSSSAGAQINCCYWASYWHSLLLGQAIFFYKLFLSN
jgi:hypothetical protein